MAVIIAVGPKSPEAKALYAAAFVQYLTGDQALADRTFRWKLAYELRRICRRRKRR